MEDGRYTYRAHKAIGPSPLMTTGGRRKKKAEYGVGGCLRPFKDTAFPPFAPSRSNQTVMEWKGYDLNKTTQLRDFQECTGIEFLDQ